MAAKDVDHSALIARIESLTRRVDEHADALTEETSEALEQLPRQRLLIAVLAAVLEGADMATVLRAANLDPETMRLAEATLEQLEGTA